MLTLKSLKGLHLRVVDHMEVFVQDLKHIFKRFRGRLISKVKTVKVGNAVVSRAYLEHLLAKAEVSNAKSLLNPQDKQNVSKAMQLLKEVQKLAGSLSHEESDTKDASTHALEVLGLSIECDIAIPFHWKKMVVVVIENGTFFGSGYSNS